MKNINTFKIIEVARGNLSMYGNPSYILTVENEQGEILTGKTASNSALGYEACYSWENTTKKLQYHYTKSGNLIFDYLKK
jgi:hypothetical protein